MTRAPLFRPQAEAEALEARRWCEARRAGLGDEFGAEVDAAVARIIEHPFAFPRVRGETRRAVLTRFPYALYFRTTDDRIIVLGGSRPAGSFTLAPALVEVAWSHRNDQYTRSNTACRRRRG